MEMEFNLGHSDVFNFQRELDELKLRLNKGNDDDFLPGVFAAFDKQMRAFQLVGVHRDFVVVDQNRISAHVKCLFEKSWKFFPLAEYLPQIEPLIGYVQRFDPRVGSSYECVKKWLIQGDHKSVGDKESRALVDLYSWLPIYRKLFVPGLYFQLKDTIAHRLLAYTTEIIDQPESYDLSKTPRSAFRIHLESEPAGTPATDVHLIPDVALTGVNRGVTAVITACYTGPTLAAAGKIAGANPDLTVAVPVLDSWVEGEPYGTLCGVVLVVGGEFADLTEKSRADLFALRSRVSSKSLESGLARAAAHEPSKDWGYLPTVLAETVGYIHDWECVEVAQDKKVRHRWTRRGESLKIPDSDGSGPGSEYESAFPDDLIQPLKEDSPLTVGLPAGKELQSLELEGIWSSVYIADLTPEESAMYGGLSFRFYYPEYAVLPTEETLRKKVDDEFRRQTLRLLQIVIWKVRARRKAVRSAVSGIIGRNMSHNIGSHVLARHSIALRTDITGADGRPNPREEESVFLRRYLQKTREEESAFLRYLQKRMDFIAEVSTSAVSLMTQPMVVGDALRPFSPDSEEFQKVLLHSITGKEDVASGVELKEGADLAFACPGGEVGVHALYVILENIIRNSARHNDAPNGTVRLEVRVRAGRRADEKPNMEHLEDHRLLEITVLDPFSHGGGPDKQQKTLPELVNHINRILDPESGPNYRAEAIMSNTGDVNPKYWGLREMQICAAYLRGRSLEDLEAPLAPDEPRLLTATEDRRDPKEEAALAYTFYLLAPRVCCLFAPKQALAKTTDLSRVGLELLDEDDLRGLTTLKISEISRYSFLVIDKSIAHAFFDAIEELKLNPRVALPARTLVLDRENVSALLGEAARGVDAAETFLTRLAYENGHPSLPRPAGLFVAVSSLPCMQNGSDLVAFYRADSCRQFVNQFEFFTTIGEPRLALTDLEYLWLDHPDQSSVCALRQSSKVKYAEALFSNSPHLTPLAEWRFHYALCFAALSHVVVFDERVQAASLEKHKEISLEILWPLMHVSVPFKRQPLEAGLDVAQAEQDEPARIKRERCLRESPLDLEHPRLDKLKELCHKLICSKPTFVVVHQTVVDALRRREGSAADTWLTEVAGRSTLVVTSGRGLPSKDTLSNSARFVPVSALLEYLVHRPSKLGLMNILWHARKPF